MSWFGKRNAQDTAAFEQEVEQISPHQTGRYSISAVTLRGGLRSRTLIVGADLSTAGVTARFLAHELRDLCTGRSQLVETTYQTATMFLATREAANPGSLTYDALVNLVPGSVALLKPTDDGIESILELAPQDVSTLGDWLITLPS